MNAERLPFARDRTSREETGPGIRRKVLCYEERMTMVRIAFEAGAKGVEHSHPHLQCSYVESGVFDITIAGRTERLTAGDSFLGRRTPDIAQPRSRPGLSSTFSRRCVGTSFEFEAVLRGSSIANGRDGLGRYFGELRP